MKHREVPITRRQCLALIAAAAAIPRVCWSESERKVLRVAVSIETLAGANINDARAAYKVWINEYLVNIGQAVAEAVPDVFIPSEDLIRDARHGAIDFFGITAWEYMKVMDLTDPNSLVLQDYVADGLEYVLLVHNSSSFKKIADLRGAQLVSHLHHDLVLLPAWLGTMLAAANLPPADRFFASHTSNDKLNQVLLPVFFRRMDGACVSKRSWETAIELNPQLGRDLRSIAVSPKVVPLLIGFRRNCNANSQRLVMDAMLRISRFVAGQQIAAIYQARNFVARPSTVMKGTIDMLHAFEQLPEQQAHARRGSS